jgi:hypothetical protein
MASKKRKASVAALTLDEDESSTKKTKTDESDEEGDASMAAETKIAKNERPALLAVDATKAVKVFAACSVSGRR